MKMQGRTAGTVDGAHGELCERRFRNGFLMEWGVKHDVRHAIEQLGTYKGGEGIRGEQPLGKKRNGL